MQSLPSWKAHCYHHWRSVFNGNKPARVIIVNNPEPRGSGRGGGSQRLRNRPFGIRGTSDQYVLTTAQYVHAYKFGFSSQREFHEGITATIDPDILGWSLKRSLLVPIILIKSSSVRSQLNKRMLELNSS